MSGVPLVSILMVARNTGPFIGEAIDSARAQSCADIEIVVVDDASSDDTKAIALSHAAQDARVRVLDGPRAGLAAVRNASLAAARGQWVLILDSDDVLAPDHVAQLVEVARRSGATMVAANMIEFQEDYGAWQTQPFASGPAWEAERRIDLAEFIDASRMFSHGVTLGYLKPLFLRHFMDDHGLRYDTELRVGEDFDLVLRAMLAGGALLYVPKPTYFYRRHAASTSARFSLSSLSALMVAAASYPLPDDAKVQQAARRYAASLGVALRLGRGVEALKARRPGTALTALGLSAQAWWQLACSAREGLARRLHNRLARPASAASAQPLTVHLNSATGKAVSS